MKKYITLVIISWIAFSGRPEKKKFHSEAVEKVIAEVKPRIKDEQIATMFENALPNTLDTTVEYFDPEKGDSFIITGDIKAMWQRDSSNQMWTYIDFIREDKDLRQLVKGTIRRQVQNVLLDPYANAFNFAKTGSDWQGDYTYRKFLKYRVSAMINQLHERKFEIDSSASVLRLQNGFYKRVADSTIYDFNNLKAISKIVKLYRMMQGGQDEERSYFFQRETEEMSDTQSHGCGFPVRRTGLVRTFFRPSDDATIYQFNIPGNAYVSSMLNETSEILSSLKEDTPFIVRYVANQLSQQSKTLGEEIRQAIFQHGINQNTNAFYYEVDGFGNGVFMDDANQPSLLSMPLFGFLSQQDQLYQNTRALLLNPNTNPYYFQGKAGKGIGGPHMGIDYIWPMSIITQAMTTDDANEIKECLRTLRDTTNATYFIHESFHKDDPSHFTRSWFAWANGLFGELVLKLDREMPEILKGDI